MHEEKFSLPKKEKDERICEKLKQGIGWRKIATEDHVSFAEISRIRKEYFKTDDDEPQNSKRSQALKLMEEGKSSLDIAIELNLSSDEVQGFRQEYLTLKDEDELRGVYRRIGGKIDSFLILYEMMNKEGLLPEEAVWALEEYGSFKNINIEYTHLTRDLRPLREETNQLEQKREMLVSENERLTDENESLTNEINQLQMRKQHVARMLEPILNFTNKVQSAEDVFE